MQPGEIYGKIRHEKNNFIIQMLHFAFLLHFHHFYENISIQVQETRALEYTQQSKCCAVNPTATMEKTKTKKLHSHNKNWTTVKCLNETFQVRIPATCRLKELYTICKLRMHFLKTSCHHKQHIFLYKSPASHTKICYSPEAFYKTTVQISLSNH